LAAGALAGRNLIYKGEFEDNGVGIWTGPPITVGQIAHPTLLRAMRAISSVNILQGTHDDRIPGDWGGRTLRFTGFARILGTATAGLAGVQGTRADGTTFTHTPNIGSGPLSAWSTFDVSLTLQEDCVAIRPWVRVPSSTVDRDHRWTDLRLEDITESLRAENEADAAATSASNAAISETDAATSASASQTAQTSAESARDDADTHAAAALSSANTASTEATAAGSSATAASTSAGQAATSEANALSYRNTTLTARDDAEAASAEATETAGIVARLNKQGMSVDPTFLDWPSGDDDPTHWPVVAGADGAINRITSAGGAKYNHAVQLHTGTVAENRPYIIATNSSGNLVGQINPEYVTVTCEVERRSNNFVGATIQATWIGTPSVSARIDIGEEYEPAPHQQIIRIEKVLKRPTSAAGVTNFSIYFWGRHSTSVGGDHAYNKIYRIHSLDVRESSEEEIRAFNVGDEIDTEVSAAVAVETAARVSSEGLAESNYTIRTQAVTGGVRAMTGIDFFSLANPDGTTVNDIVMMADRLKLFASTTGTEKPMFSIDGDSAYFNMDLVATGSIFASQLHASAISRVQNPARLQATADISWTGDVHSLQIDYGNLGTVNALRIRPDNANANVYSDYFDVDASKSYRVNASIYCAHADGRRYFGVLFYDRDGVNITSEHDILNAAGDAWDAGSGNPYFYNVTGVNGRVDIDGTMAGFHVAAEATPVGATRTLRIPERAVQARLRFGSLDQTSVVNAYMTNTSVSDVDAGLITGKRIVAGSIETQQLAAGAVTATEIDVNTLSAIVTNTGALTISGNTQSSNYSVANETGFQLRPDGSATFYGVVLSRQLEVDSGTILVTNTGGTGGSWEIEKTVYVETTAVNLTAWQGLEETYVAEAGFGNGITVTVNPATNPDNYWGVRATIIPATRWSAPQTLRLRLDIYQKNVQSISGSGGTFPVDWRIYKVT